jgi:hypothetical protein
MGSNQLRRVDELVEAYCREALSYEEGLANAEAFRAALIVDDDTSIARGD